MKYLNGDCKCRICEKIHYCPDGCAVHFHEDKCTCTSCYINLPLKEKIKLDKEKKDENTI